MSVSRAASAAQVASRVWQDPGCRGQGSAEALFFRHVIAGEDIASVISPGKNETVVELEGGIPFTLSTAVLEEIRPDFFK